MTAGRERMIFRLTQKLNKKIDAGPPGVCPRSPDAHHSAALPPERSTRAL